MKKIDILMALLVAASWGINAPIVKMTLEEMPLFFFCAVRSGLLSFILLICHKTLYPYRVVLSFTFFHGLKISFLYGSIFVGLSAGLSTVILQTQSIFAVLFAAVLFRERITAKQMVGLLISTFGVALISREALSLGSYLGLFYAAISAVAAGAAIITLRGYKKVDISQGLAFVGWFNLFSILPFTLISLFVEGLEPWRNALTILLNARIILLLFSGMVTVVFAYVFLALVLARNQTIQVSGYLLLTPVFGLISSYSCLNERCTLLAGVGTAIIIAGLAVNQGISFKHVKD